MPFILSMKPFFSNTAASDTIPLKLVVYLGLLAVVLLFSVRAWENTTPVLEAAKTENQLDEAALVLRSIQSGYARELSDRHGPDGTMCSLSFSLPASVSFVSFGVDPDPDLSGNLSDSEWTLANNTLICQYADGVRKRVLMEGPLIFFCQGKINEKRRWEPVRGLFDPGTAENSSLQAGGRQVGVVIEAPGSGNFIFELVSENGTRYTMARF